MMSSLREMAGEAANTLIVFVGMAALAVISIGMGATASNGFLIDFIAPVSFIVSAYLALAVEERELLITPSSFRVILVLGALATLAVLAGQWYAINPSPLTSGVALVVALAIPCLATAEMYVDIPVFTRLIGEESGTEVSA